MKIKIEKKIKSNKGLLVVPIFKEDLKKLPSRLPSEVRDLLKRLINNKDFDGKDGKTITSCLSGKKNPESLLIIGLGEKGKFSHPSARNAGGKIGKCVKGAKKQELTILLPSELEKYSQEIIEGVYPQRTKLIN